MVSFYSTAAIVTGHFSLLLCEFVSVPECEPGTEGGFLQFKRFAENQCPVGVLCPCRPDLMFARTFPRRRHARLFPGFVLNLSGRFQGGNHGAGSCIVEPMRW